MQHFVFYLKYKTKINVGLGLILKKEETIVSLTLNYSRRRKRIL